jgi:hypothetical protein
MEAIAAGCLNAVFDNNRTAKEEKSRRGREDS